MGPLTFAVAQRAAVGAKKQQPAGRMDVVLHSSWLAQNGPINLQMIQRPGMTHLPRERARNQGQEHEREQSAAKKPDLSY